MGFGGRVESQVSPFPPGSGRMMDYTYPDWQVIGNNTTTSNERDRPGAQGANPSALISSGATGTVACAVINGVSCYRCINGANLGGGPSVITDGMGRFHFATLSSGVKYSTLDDSFAVHRIYMIARVTATPTDATDTGLQLVLGGNAGSGIFFNSVPGIGIQFDNTGGCSYVQHGNSGAVTSNVLQSAAGGFVNTNFHKFEFRIINATPNTNGIVKVFLDDKLALTKNFGSVPDDLPLPSSPGANGNNGYTAHFIYWSRNGEMDVALVRCQRGPTEQAVIS